MFNFRLSILLSLLCIQYSESSGRENGDVIKNNTDENSDDSAKDDVNNQKMTRTPIQLCILLFYYAIKVVTYKRFWQFHGLLKRGITFVN